MAICGEAEELRATRNKMEMQIAMQPTFRNIVLPPLRTRFFCEASVDVVHNEKKAGATAARVADAGPRMPRARASSYKTVKFCSYRCKTSVQQASHLQQKRATLA